MINNNVDINYVDFISYMTLRGHVKICRLIIEDMKEKTPVLNHDVIQWWQDIESYEIVKMTYRKEEWKNMK